MLVTYNSEASGDRALVNYEKQEGSEGGIDGIPALTRNFYNTISHNSVNVNAKIIEGMISIFQNIITNPYDDRARIVEPLHYNKSKLFSYPSCLQYLRDLGFVNGKKEFQLLFPYDLMIAKLIRAKEALSQIHEQKIQEIHILDVENRVTFPYFQQYCQILSTNLAMKNNKVERQRLQMSLDEASEFYHHTKTLSLEEMIVEFMSDPQSFQNLTYSIFSSQQKAKEFILTELWLETNVLRKFGVYITQCFSDSISRAPLTAPHESDSKTARQILMIDLLQAQGIAKMSQGAIKTLEDLVRVFLIRNRLKTEEISENFEALDTLLEKAMYSRNKVNDFWKNLEDVVVERVSGKAKKNRPLLDSAKFQKWCSLNPPPLEPTDLPSYAKDRLAQFASEVHGMELEQGIETLYELEPEVREEKLKKLRDLIWEARVWLHQKDLTDDYIVYTAVRDMCDHAGVDMSLDIRMEFRDFIKGGMPTLELPESMGNTTLFQHSAFKNMHKSTEFLTRRSQNLAIGNSDVSIRVLEDKGESWRMLYRKMTPAILHSCVINKHEDLVQGFLSKGAFVNIRDHKKWTPLHCAAMIGHINIVNLLIDHKADLDAEEEQGRTPFKIAVEYGNYFDEMTWDMLLMYSLENDVVCYVKLAHKNRIFLHNVDDTNKFSLHMAMRFQAANVIRLLISLVDSNTLRAFANARDLDGKTADDWADETHNQEIIDLSRRISGMMKTQSKVPQIIAEQDRQFSENENNMKVTIERLMEENNLRESLMNLSKLKHVESQKLTLAQLQKSDRYEKEEMIAHVEEHKSKDADEYAQAALHHAEALNEKKKTPALMFNSVTVPVEESDDDKPMSLIHLIKNQMHEFENTATEKQANLPWNARPETETDEIVKKKDGEIRALKDEIHKQSQQVEDMKQQLRDQLDQSKQQTSILAQTQAILQSQIESNNNNNGLEERLHAERARHEQEISKLRDELSKVMGSVNQNVEKLSGEISNKQKEMHEIKREKDEELKRVQEQVSKQAEELTKYKDDVLQHKSTLRQQSQQDAASQYQDGGSQTEDYYDDNQSVNDQPSSYQHQYQNPQGVPQNHQMAQSQPQNSTVDQNLIPQNHQMSQSQPQNLPVNQSQLQSQYVNPNQQQYPANPNSNYINNYQPPNNNYQDQSQLSSNSLGASKKKSKGCTMF